jgi:ferredoxin
MKLIHIPMMLLALVLPVEAFSPIRLRTMHRIMTNLFSSFESCEAGLLSVSLEKPLGIILEEIQEGAAMGVKVKELADSGSAYASEYKNQLVGLKLSRVMQEDVTCLDFDSVMEKIIEAPSPLSIDFEIENVPSVSEETEEVSTESEPQSDLGTVVTINVIQEGKPDLAIEAKVGDNLRRILLDNDVEVYRGLKKKLGNCGGNGQCTFCAVDFVETTGWEARSEYEEGKIAKWPTARLACMNNIQGPATIRVQ